MSIYRAYRYNKDIVFHLIEIDSLDVFIEKGRKKEVILCNLSPAGQVLGNNNTELCCVCALGADSEENEDSVKTSVMQKMAKAVGATAVVTSDVLSAVASYNPVSLMYK
jgi:hypothetical protein